ncbi:capsular biosynthesis protein [Virgibacillus profundi]|uniref:Capsular biosynthesis protein n=1 Tax=Virgibacillus profundi TaxID=2024555 RepID=A0A2A2IJV9_9BACI|nr:EpsG family protein [Virgibacillus profundi]PAV31554.1 capsular biosynthesis protein [Virgibacillus profundi]PXY55740.1 EpsG family protein [Virgibacillus profundi]
MTLLWMNLAIVFSFAIFARYFTPTLASGIPFSIRPHKLLIFGSLLVLVLISGLRSNIGDTFNYINIFEENDFTWEYVLSEKDIGFGILQMFLKNYISQDPQVMIFTTALITNLIIILVLYNYSRLIELSLYVYITGGLFLVSMNGIRQVLAAAITFAAIKYLINGSFIKYAIIIVLASFFHQSALILLPIYFLVRFKAWSKATVALVMLSVVAVIGYEQFSSLLFTALEDTQYAAYDSFAEGGANILRVAVEGAPIIFAYLGREKLKQIFPNSDFIVNMALIGFVFMVIATQQWIFARISIYFQLYQLILIAWIPKLFREKDQKLIYFGILICYFAYYYYESVISLNIVYRSDFLIW